MTLEARPNYAEKIRSSAGILVVVTGPTGSGKEKLIEGIKDEESENVVTYASRARRDKEIHGKDYFFITPKEFEYMIENNEFLEHVNYGNTPEGWKGTTKESVVPTDANKIWRIEMSRATTLEEAFDKLGKDAAEELLRRSIVILVGVPSLTLSKDRATARDRREFEKDAPKYRAKLRERFKHDWKVWQEHREAFTFVDLGKNGELMFDSPEGLPEEGPYYFCIMNRDGELEKTQEIAKKLIDAVSARQGDPAVN